MQTLNVAHFSKCIASSLVILTLAASVTLTGFAESMPVQLSGGTKTVDLPEGSADKISIQVKQGRFASQSVGDLKLEVDGIDYQQGALDKLHAEFREAQFDTVPVDFVQIDTGAFNFNTLELLNHRRFVLNQPTTGDVKLKITEDGLNRLFSHPKLISNLEKAVAKQTGNIKLVTFTNPSLDLLSGNKFKLNMTVNMAGAMAAPIQMDGKLSLGADGNVLFQDITAVTNGVPLPVEIAPLLEQQLNKLVNFRELAKKYFVINTEKLKVSDKDLMLEGKATLTKLDIGL